MDEDQKNLFCMLKENLEVVVEFTKAQIYYDTDTIKTTVIFCGEVVSETTTYPHL